MAGPAGFSSLPTEVVLEITSLLVEDVQGVFNERLERIKVDEAWHDLRAVNKKFRGCVETVVQTPQIVIRAGEKVPDDQARSLYGRNPPRDGTQQGYNTEEGLPQESDSSGNYPQLVPFDVQIFVNTLAEAARLRPFGWDRGFLLAVAFFPTVTIDITHPSQLAARSNGQYRSWSSVLCSLRLLQGPLTMFLVQLNCGNKKKTLCVEFMSRTPVNDGDLKILDFDGAPDTHWKYQPVQQVLAVLSYLNHVTNRNPWDIMTTPNMLIANTKTTPLTGTDILDHTRRMEASLHRAFNSDNSGNPLTDYRRDWVGNTNDIRLYHCLDKVRRTAAVINGWTTLTRPINWTPACVVRNLHKMPAATPAAPTTTSQAPGAPTTAAAPAPAIAPAEAFTITRLEDPTNALIDQWRSPTGHLTQVQAEVASLSLFPADDDTLRSDYAALRSLADGMDAILRPPHRLRPDLADLRAGPLAEFWARAPAFRRDVQARVRSGHAEDLRRAAAVAAGTVVLHDDDEDGWSDDHAVDVEEWARQFESDGDEDGDDESGALAGFDDV